MNTALVLLYVAGTLMLAISCLRYLEDAKARAPVSRILLLALLVLALMAAIEVLASPQPQRPWSALMVFVLGSIALWKAFVAEGTRLGSVVSAWRHRRDQPPSPITPQG